MVWDRIGSNAGFNFPQDFRLGFRQEITGQFFFTTESAEGTESSQIQSLGDLCALGGGETWMIIFWRKPYVPKAATPSGALGASPFHSRRPGISRSNNFPGNEERPFEHAGPNLKKPVR